MKTTERMLRLLQMFTVDFPEWSVDDAAQALGLAQSTTYDYFRDLLGAGLLVGSRTGHYVIGPAIIEFDRLARISDPMISKAQPIMQSLAKTGGVQTIALVCRLYRMSVLCVAQHAIGQCDFSVSYERGRPMPLFRGAASKIILAHIERRKLRRYFDEWAPDIAAAGLGTTWEDFRTGLRRIRAQPVLSTEGELDVGRVGISAPVFSPEDEILGSVSLVVLAGDLARSPGLADMLALRVGEAGERLTQAMRSAGGDQYR